MPGAIGEKLRAGELRCAEGLELISLVWARCLALLACEDGYGSREALVTLG
jgi:hypothetical protein